VRMIYVFVCGCVRVCVVNDDEGHQKFQQIIPQNNATIASSRAQDGQRLLWRERESENENDDENLEKESCCRRHNNVMCIGLVNQTVSVDYGFRANQFTRSCH